MYCSQDKETVVRFDFKKAKFEDISFETSSVGNKKNARLKFKVELNPDNPDMGFYISGKLNIDAMEEYILDESGNPIVDFDETLLVANYIPIF